MNITVESEIVSETNPRVVRFNRTTDIIDPNYPFNSVALWHNPQENFSFHENNRSDIARSLVNLCCQNGLDVFLTDAMVDLAQAHDYDFRTGTLQWPRDWGVVIPDSDIILVPPSSPDLDSELFLRQQLKTLSFNAEGFKFVESRLGEGGVSSYSSDGRVWLVRDDLMDDPGVRLLQDNNRLVIPFPHLLSTSTEFDFDSDLDPIKERAMANLLMRAHSGHMDFEARILKKQDTQGRPFYGLLVNESMDTLFRDQIEKVRNILKKVNSDGNDPPKILVPFDEEQYLIPNAIDLPGGKTIFPAGIQEGELATIEKLKEFLGEDNVIPFHHHNLASMTSAFGQGSLRCLSFQFTTS